MADRVSFTVQGADYLNLQARAIECLNELFKRDVLDAKAGVRWTLDVTPLVIHNATGKPSIWTADVEASVSDQSATPDGDV